MLNRCANHDEKGGCERKAERGHIFCSFCRVIYHGKAFSIGHFCMLMGKRISPMGN